jgi:hypothetical protein
VEQPAALTPDGSTAITGWWVAAKGAAQRSELVAIDLASGQRRTLLAREDTDFVAPVVAPDGRTVVCGAEVHGTLDEAPYRGLRLVPLDQTPARAAFRVWPVAAEPGLCRDLIRDEVDAKFLYYPDENHWILGPGNAAVWYEAVLAFLAQHVLGEPWRRPALV